MHLHIITVGLAQSNCFILWNDTKQALVIDPGGEPEQILDFLTRRQLRVVAYPLTHGHVDHVQGLAAVHREQPAPMGMHPADAAWAFTERNQLPPFYGPPEDPGPMDRRYEEGQTWTDAGFTYQVLHTPGHTPGGVSFYLPREGLLFSGDCLFMGSIGRTDLPGGDYPVLQESLRRLSALPDPTRVLPGHGPETTIGAEKGHNPFLRGL